MRPAPLPLVVLLILMAASVSLPAAPDAVSTEDPLPANLEVVVEGPHLILYTSGRAIAPGRNRKSGVWSVPSRMLTEMWVKKGENTGLVRLDVHAFRKQLTGLFPEYPEVHGFISSERFSYKLLPEGIRELNRHIAKVASIRKERKRIQSEVIPLLIE